MSSTRREGRTREVPWDDLPANTDGLVTGVCKLRLTRLNGLAMILVRPAGVVANTSRRALNFTFCLLERFPCEMVVIHPETPGDEKPYRHREIRLPRALHSWHPSGPRAYT